MLVPGADFGILVSRRNQSSETEHECRVHRAREREAVGKPVREKSVAAENPQAGHRSSTVFQQRRFGTTRKWVAGGVRAGLDRSEDAEGAP